MTQIETIFTKFTGSSHELIPLLQAVQHEFGYLSEENMAAIAKFLKIPQSRVYSVATFYAQFRFSPIGKNHIMICRGTACHVKGAPRLLEEIQKELGVEEGETTADGKFSFETVACIGACGLAPTMVINEKTYGRLTPKTVKEVLSDVRSKEEEQ